MTDKLTNGDYTLLDGKKGLLQCDYTDELMQNALVLLTAKRDEFYPNKDFGSQIARINMEPKDDYLAAYASQALSSLDGVYVKEAYFEDKIAYITMMLNDKERTVAINLENNL